MKRRWFQIHLSTALVMMLVVSFFLFLNLSWCRVVATNPEGAQLSTYGWPIQGALWNQAVYHVWVPDSNGSSLTLYSEMNWKLFQDWILPDTLPCLVTVVACALLMELVIRLPKYRKGSERRWFQIHQITVIAIIVIVLGFLCLNLMSETRDIESDPIKVYGWPWEWRSVHPLGYNQFTTLIRGLNVLLNSGILFLSAGSVALSLEVLLRRREARDP